MPMNNAEKINAWFQRFEHRMEATVPNIIAEEATEYFKERFDKQNWDNVPWQPLNPKYAAKKTRGKNRILYRIGGLQNSIRPTFVSAGRITISAGNSKVPYARRHNEGFSGPQLVPSYTNRNFMGRGKPVQIRSHIRQGYTPRRQFMGHSAILNRRIIQRLKLAFK